MAQWTCCCCACINEKTVGVIENCGEYSRIAPPGFTFLMCPCESIRDIVTMKICQLAIVCNTQTKDNVFVKVNVAVQYQVVDGKVDLAYYKLTDHRAQITNYVFDSIRAAVPKHDLDGTFAQKTEIAHFVEGSLSESMSKFGYRIIHVLITDIDPDHSVKAAMNDINASTRLREANAYKAEAEKILLVKAAEAESESKHLTGIGIARQRTAIVDGLRTTVNEFANSVQGSTAKDVMDLLLLTQYFDTMKEMHSKSMPNSVFLPHGPAAVTELRKQLQDSFQVNNTKNK